ncbi:uncharacterized protein LOC123296182 [Chrysoperla carnea]|uniref:uncharacterized protein LOC123296182 n=1 Tax=Chrysoperla carnea TaxID=189513 RepID=UPI001D0976FA|nr:uncharacterized protein LOC123296182 [Chrysoperla carnea]
MIIRNFYYYLIIVIILLLIDIPKGFSIDLNVRIIIPENVYENDSITLYCLYDLGNQALYAVNWYRGEHEFFRYNPQDVPAYKMWPYINSQYNIPVEISNSDENKVTFKAVNKILSGNFTCEVTTDVPLFSIGSATALLKIKSKQPMNIQESYSQPRSSSNTFYYTSVQNTQK